MSYEGDEEHLCENGHRWTIPCQYSDDLTPACPVCKAPSAWVHGIDHTNSDSTGIIPEPLWDPLTIEAETQKTCEHCGETKRTPARYRQPTRDELKAMEHTWDWRSEKYVPIASLSKDKA